MRLYALPTRSQPRRLFASVLLAGLLLHLPLPALAAEGETLLIFTRDAASAVSQAFDATYLPQIESLAAGMGIPTQRVTVSDEVPTGVTMTPLLVYQNHRGRSLYQGRYTALGRIRTFLRTARHLEQEQSPDRRKSMAVWPMGQSKLWAPIKISDVTGTPPEGHRPSVFQTEARQAVLSGLQHFRQVSEVSLSRTDRGFYMDFYPWRSADGTLFLSLALYSQFDCKAPIFTTADAPLVGAWSDRKQLFTQAAERMEQAVAAAVAEAEKGDGFDPLPGAVAAVSWGQMGLSLPPAPTTPAPRVSASLKIPTRWVLAVPEAEAPPLIQFYFPAPLDHYRGEVTAAEGELTLGADGHLEGATGEVWVDTRNAVTMGDPILDEALAGQALLGARQYPQAAFRLTSTSGDGQPLAFGRLSPARLDGTFTLKGAAMPLSLNAQMEPAIGTDGNVQLLVETAFEIDLTRFAIEGADGPAPQRDTLRFDLNLVFKAADP